MSEIRERLLSANRKTNIEIDTPGRSRLSSVQWAGIGTRLHVSGPGFRMDVDGFVLTRTDRCPSKHIVPPTVIRLIDLEEPQSAWDYVFYENTAARATHAIEHMINRKDNDKTELPLMPRKSGREPVDLNQSEYLLDCFGRAIVDATPSRHYSSDSPGAPLVVPTWDLPLKDIGPLPFYNLGTAS